MARIIEFRVPRNYSTPARWVRAEDRGKVIKFRAQQKKSA